MKKGLLTFFVKAIVEWLATFAMGRALISKNTHQTNDFNLKFQHPEAFHSIERLLPITILSRMKTKFLLAQWVVVLVFSLGIFGQAFAQGDQTRVLISGSVSQSDVCNLSSCATVTLAENPNSNSNSDCAPADFLSDNKFSTATPKRGFMIYSAHHYNGGVPPLNQDDPTNAFTSEEWSALMTTLGDQNSGLDIGYTNQPGANAHTITWHQFGYGSSDWAPGITISNFDNPQSVYEICGLPPGYYWLRAWDCGTDADGNTNAYGTGLLVVSEIEKPTLILPHWEGVNNLVGCGLYEKQYILRFADAPQIPSAYGPFTFSTPIPTAGTCDNNIIVETNPNGVIVVFHGLCTGVTYNVIATDKCGNEYPLVIGPDYSDTNLGLRNLDFDAADCSGANLFDNEFGLNNTIFGATYTIVVTNTTNPGAPPIVFHPQNGTNSATDILENYSVIDGWQISGLITGNTYVMTVSSNGCQPDFVYTFTPDIPGSIQDDVRFWVYNRCTEGVDGASMWLGQYNAAGNFVPSQGSYPPYTFNAIEIYNSVTSTWVSTGVTSLGQYGGFNTVGFNQFVPVDLGTYSFRTLITDGCEAVHYNYFDITRNWLTPPSLSLTLDADLADCASFGSILLDVAGEANLPEFTINVVTPPIDEPQHQPVNHENGGVLSQPDANGNYWSVIPIQVPPGSPIQLGAPLTPSTAGNLINMAAGNTDYSLNNLSANGVYRFRLQPFTGISVSTSDCYFQEIEVNVVGANNLPNVDITVSPFCNSNPCFTIYANAYNGAGRTWTWSFLSSNLDNYQTPLGIIIDEDDDHIDKTFCNHTQDIFYKIRVADKCGNAVISEEFTPNPAASISPVIGGISPICAGQNIVLSVTDNGIDFPTANISYLWQSSPNGSAPWTDIPWSLNTLSLNPTTDIYIQVQVILNNVNTSLADCVSPFSDVYHIVVAPAFVANITGPSSVCSPYNGLANLVTNVTPSNPAYVYDWTSNNPGFAGSSTNTANPIGPGTYTVEVSDGSGCVATSSFEFTVQSPILVSLPPNDVLCDLSSFQIPTYAITPDQAYIFQWTSSNPSVNINTNSGQNPEITNIPYGTTTFTVVVTSRDLCTGSDTYTITNNQSAAVGVTGETEYCQGEIATINLQYFGTTGFGIVSPSSAGSLSSVFYPLGNSQATFTPNSGFTGPVTLQFSTFDPDGTGPCQAATQSIVLNYVGNPTISCSTNSPVCSGSTIQLTATVGGSGPYSYAWTGPNGFSSSLQNPTIANASAAMAGTYTVVVTNTATLCTNSCQTVVVVNGGIPASLSNNGPICQGELATFTALPAPTGYTYTFSGTEVGGPNAVITDNILQIQSQTTTPAGNYTYTVIVTDIASGCTGQSTSIQVVRALPIVTLSANFQDLCASTPLVLTATIQNPSPLSPIHFIWGDPTGDYFNGGPINTYTFNNPINGIYYIGVTSYTTGCHSSSSVQINVTAPINVNITYPSTFCLGDEINLTANASGNTVGASYQWYQGSTPITGATGNTLLISPTIPATAYSVQVTSSDRYCTSTSSVTPVPLNPSSVSNFDLSPLSFLCDQGSGAYQASWSINGWNSATATLTGGTFTIEFSDGIESVFIQAPSVTRIGNNYVFNFGISPGYTPVGVCVTGLTLTDIATGCSRIIDDCATFNNSVSVQFTNLNMCATSGTTLLTYNANPTGGIWTVASGAPRATLVSGQPAFNSAGLAPGSYVGSFTYAPAGMACSEVVSFTVNIRSDCGCVGDFVWNDADSDGIQDSGETGVNGVTVSILSCDPINGSVGATLQTMQTINNPTTGLPGYYQFCNLEIDQNYIVQFTSPDGYTFTQSTGGDATQNNNDSDANTITGMTNCFLLPTTTTTVGYVDAGLVPAGDIGNFVWYDTDGDGVQDPGETGVPGVTVTLYNATNNQVVGTATTDGNGGYLFTNIPGGNYYVVFTNIPSNNFFTTPSSTSNPATNGNDSDANTNGTTGTFTFNPANDELDIDAGIVGEACIGNFVWSDTDGDGIQDPGEPGINGVSVQVFVCNNGTPGALPTANTTTTNDPVTGLPGYYEVCGLNPSLDYAVTFGTPSGTTPTTQNAPGSTEANDSDINASGMTGCIDIEPGDNDDIDAGFEPDTSTGNIGNFVWYDTDGDGLQDPGETGVPGVTVTLYDATNNQVVGTATTDGNGGYLFTNIPAGDYYVVFTNIPSNNFFTTPSSTSNPATSGNDSDANTNGTTGTFTFNPANDELDIDAGIVLEACVGNFVWHDLNGNGIQDAGEPGLNGFTIELYQCEDGNANTGIDTYTATTGNHPITGEPGYYQICGLNPSLNYSPYIYFNISENWYLPTISNASGSNEENDSDFVEEWGTNCIDIDPGVNNYIDFGVIDDPDHGNVGDTVWYDTDGDGLQDAGEAGVPGVTVTLYNASNNQLMGTTATDENGHYLFTYVPAGDFYVVFSGIPGGNVFTTPSSTSNPATNGNDSDANINGTTGTFTFNPANDELDIDAGIVLTACLSNFVWHDVNGNGIQDAGEPGINGVNVEAYPCENGNPSGTGLTAITGNDPVTGLPGYYQICGLNPSLDYAFAAGFSGSNWLLENTIQNAAGSNENNDSDLSASGISDCMDIVPGTNNTNFDAGFVCIDYFDAIISGPSSLDCGELGSATVTPYIAGSPFSSFGGNYTANYVWSNGSLGATATGLTAGTYTVVVTSTRFGVACSTTAAITIQSESNCCSMGGTVWYEYSSASHPAQGIQEQDMPIDGSTISEVSDLNTNTILTTALTNVSSFTYIGGVSNVGVSLINNATGEVVTTATTTADGNYMFSNLVCATYYVLFDISSVDAVNGQFPTGTIPNASGSTPSNDSDGVLSGTVYSTETSPVTLVVDQPDYTTDFGIVLGTLPIELKSFDGKGKNCRVELSWTTASEKDNKEFVVEKSLDGVRFFEIARVAGSRNSNTEKTYNFIDTKIGGVGYYYRLKQVDMDGTTKMVANKYVGTDCSTYTQPGISGLYPNPVSGNQMVTIKYNASLASKVRVSLVTVDGKVMRWSELDVQEGINTMNLNINGLPAGAYFVQIQGEGIPFSAKKLIKTE